MAAPISRGGQVIAGISLVSVPQQTEKMKIDGYIVAVKDAAATISQGLVSDPQVISR